MSDPVVRDVHAARHHHDQVIAALTRIRTSGAPGSVSLVDCLVEEFIDDLDARYRTTTTDLHVPAPESGRDVLVGDSPYADLVDPSYAAGALDDDEEQP